MSWKPQICHSVMFKYIVLVVKVTQLFIKTRTPGASVSQTLIMRRVCSYLRLFSFVYLHGADPEGLMQALEELDYLAALDDDGNLSEIGIIMSEIPLEPQMAKALLASCEFDCVSEMLTVAAMLSGAFRFFFCSASAPFQQLIFRRAWLLEELQ